MKKIVIFSSLILAALACSFLSGAGSTPTARVEVVYRAPKDMNLQPTDVPELKETPVATPPPKPLLPEGTDQDQRTYGSPSQDIRVESNVIYVPEPSRRSLDEIYDLVIFQRRPGAIRIGAGVICAIGDNCILIQFGGPGGPGFVLIFLRNNVVVVLIGSGGDITDAFMLRLAKSVDDRVRAAPSGQELALATQNAPTPTPPASDDCGRLGLSSEECANAGTHSYSYETYNSCNPQKHTGTIQAAITFSSGGFTIVFSNDSGGSGASTSYNYVKVGHNTYQCEYTDSAGGSVKDTIVFGMDGLYVTNSALLSSGQNCDGYWTGRLAGR